ncbi:MAG: c-type cytochrome [Thermodesulfobacteriota bacterium]
MRKSIIALFVFVPCLAAFLTLSSAAEKGDAAKGKETFQNTCASCHGPEGKGDGVAAAALNPKPRNLSDAAVMSTITDDTLHKAISEGGASVGLSPMMAAWGGVLSDQDIWNVIAYIRQDLCKCQYNGK